MAYARRDPHLVVPTWSTNILGNSHTSQNHSNRVQMHLLLGGGYTVVDHIWCVKLQVTKLVMLFQNNYGNEPYEYM